MSDDKDKTLIVEAQAAILKPAVPKPRLVVVESVYHQLQGQQPTMTESRYNRWLESDEQPYQRKMKVTQEWRALDLGWIEEVGLLLLANEEPKFQSVPTDEERQRAMAKVIEIGVLPPGSWGMSKETSVEPFICWQILPGESLRAQPFDYRVLRICCRSGTTSCTLTAFPS